VSAGAAWLANALRGTRVSDRHQVITRWAAFGEERAKYFSIPASRRKEPGAKRAERPSRTSVGITDGGSSFLIVADHVGWGQRSAQMIGKNEV